jgi:hypothetical protein
LGWNVRFMNALPFPIVEPPQCRHAVMHSQPTKPLRHLPTVCYRAASVVPVNSRVCRGVQCLAAWRGYPNEPGVTELSPPVDNSVCK